MEDQAPQRESVDYLPTASPPDREEWSAMILELQANRLAFDRLSNRCAMFRFTGGVILREQWDTSRMRSYVARWPVLVTQAETKRYMALVDSLSEFSLETPATARPKTLRHRHAIADALGAALLELSSLGRHFESALQRAVTTTELASTIH